MKARTHGTGLRQDTVAVFPDEDRDTSTARGAAGASIPFIVVSGIISYVR
jgi:hypothetical protein